MNVTCLLTEVLHGSLPTSARVLFLGASRTVSEFLEMRISPPGLF